MGWDLSLRYSLQSSCGVREPYAMNHLHLSSAEVQKVLELVLKKVKFHGGPSCQYFPFFTCSKLQISYDFCVLLSCVSNIPYCNALCNSIKEPRYTCISKCHHHLSCSSAAHSFFGHFSICCFIQNNGTKLFLIVRTG